jgi:hypothetical protein
VILSITFYFIGHVLVVEQVYCIISTSSTPCPQSLQDDVQELVGKPLFFYNFEQKLSNLRAANLPFTKVEYYKILPHSLLVDFAFTDPLYQLTSDGATFWSFDEQGQYTITPAAQNVLRVWAAEESVSRGLSVYQVEDLLHQKLRDLAYLSQDSRANWTLLELIALNQLEITTDKATYVLDLFSLDEDLQQLDYLEANWRPEIASPRVDLRLRLPVVQTPTN